MTIFPREDPSSATLAAYLEGELTASEAMQLGAALARCADAQRRLCQLREIRTRLRSPDPELEGVDLSAGIQRMIGAPRRVPALRAWLGALSIAGLAAAFALVARAPHAAEFRAKSAAPYRANAPQASVQLHRLRDRARPEPAPLVLRPRERLLFSYVNRGARPFAYLMVFAVDAAGQVRWFEPAYVQQGTDPEAMRIQSQERAQLIPDVIEQAFAPGALVIYALFTHAPLRVSTVEGWLATQGNARLALPLTDAELQVIERTVEP